MTGTGGALSLKTDAGILVTPSGILKESVVKDDIFTLDIDGAILGRPSSTTLKYSSCFPNFQHIYKVSHCD